jgi:hypothetical protein
MSTTIGTESLTFFNSKENSRTWILAPHTVAKPALVIQKRTQANPTDPNSYQSSTLMNVQGTVDAESNPMSKKITIETVVKYPVGAAAADVDAALASHKAIIADAVFNDMAKTQVFVAE